MRDDGAELRTLSEADEHLKGETDPLRRFVCAVKKTESAFLSGDDGETKQRVLRRLFLGDAGTNAGLSSSRLTGHKREEQVDVGTVHVCRTEKIRVKAAPRDWERLSVKTGNLTSSSKKV